MSPTPVFSAWWNFANGAVDATGNGNDGTLHGTTLTTDPYGRSARRFNGTSDYIDGSSAPLDDGVIIVTNLSPAAASLAMVGVTPQRVNSGDVDADVAAWKAATITAGGTVSGGRQTLYTSFVSGLKSDGIWSTFDGLWVIAAENNQGGLIDLAKRKQATLIGAPPFTVDRGYTCDPSNYINTTFNFLTDGVQFTAHVAHLACWNLTSGASGNPTLASTAGTVPHHIFPQHTDNNIYIRVNDTVSPGFVTADCRGLLLGVRTDDFTRQGYQNGVSLGTYGSVPAAGLLTSDSLIVYNRQVAAISIGGPFTPTGQLAYYNRLRTLMTAIGVP